MKIILEKETDVNDVQVLYNWLDVALKQIGGKAAKDFVYFETIINEAIVEYQKKSNEEKHDK
jgi:hypothetical protein